MSNTSELEHLVVRLEGMSQHGSGVDQMIASDLLDLALALQSDLSKLEQRLEALEDNSKHDDNVYGSY